MAEEHTPTEAQVRECFVDGAEGDFIGEDFDRWLAEVRRERDEARRQLADLRAGIEALAAEFEKPSPSTLAYKREVVRAVRALLAGSGEQPGEDVTCSRCQTCGRDQRAGWCKHPAPAVPDSADVRGELLHVLDSHGIDTYIDGTGAEVGVQNLITDILAVVGQGVTAEQAWDEGYAGGLRDAGRGEPGSTPNPYRAAVRPSGQERADG